MDGKDLVQLHKAIFDMKQTFFIVILISFFAMAALAQQTPELLGKLWVEAIRAQSIEKVKSLVHPNCPRELVKSNILERMIEGELPPQLSIETLELGPKNLLEKVYFVIPEKQLNLKYITKTEVERKKFGIGKGFPIAKLNDRWYFAICLKSK